MKKFGKKLRALRNNRGITLKELAAEMGFNAHGYISEVESGKKKPSIEFVLKASRFFDVTTDELLKDEIDLEMKS
ncbi:MAG: helix-turn-helix transcriptional regulator [Deltaproteobacteria bacterium]|nr:helix-turn-helix transcriptional regulator [Deltaproteobacteria bacterium]